MEIKDVTPGTLALMIDELAIYKEHFVSKLHEESKRLLLSHLTYVN